MLEIEDRRVRLALGELEGAEENPDPNPNPIGQKEALAEVADGVGDAGVVGVLAGGALVAACAAPTGVVVLELLDRVAEPLLRLPQAALGGGGSGGGGVRGLGIGGGEERHGGRR